MVVGVCIVVSSSFVWASDNSPFEKDEAAAYLTDINDNETAVLITGATGIAVDGFIGVALTALLYVLFRDRSRVLATVMLVALLVQAVISVVVDGSNILLAIIANDFVNGGPSGVAAGDPSALEVGRYVGMFNLLFTNVLLTPLGLGLISLGLLIARSPYGAINPPRWLGWVAITAGVCAELAWLVYVFEPAFVFYVGNLLASLVFMIGLGVWLFAHRDLVPAGGAA